MRAIAFSLALAVLFCAAAVVYAQQASVIKFRRDTVQTYRTTDGEHFKRGEKVDVSALPPLPIPVDGMSSKGFVRIRTAEGALWFRQMEVEIDDGEKGPSNLKRSAASASVQSNYKNGSVRGIGE